MYLPFNPFGPLGDMALAQITGMDLEIWQRAADAISAAVYVLITIAVATALIRALDATAQRAINRALRIDEGSPRETVVRAQTLSSIITNAGRLIIMALAALMVLGQIGFNVTALLASAGLAGLAVGLAAQSIIRDFLSGFLILLEDQFCVGDVIKVGEHSGLVEKLDLRRTVLRNVEGAVISIPNGEIRIVQNLTREWSRVALDVNISNISDVDRAVALLRQVASELAEDPEFGSMILEAPIVPGIEALGDTNIKLRILVKTLPMKQWDVARALRARILAAFDREDIEMTYRQQLVLKDERKQTPV